MKSFNSLPGTLFCSPFNENEIIITGCNLTVLQVSPTAHWFWDLGRISITTTLLSEEYLALLSVVKALVVKAGIKFSASSTGEMKETFTILFYFCKCNLFSVPFWQLGKRERNTCWLSTVSTLFETAQLQSKYISFIYQAEIHNRSCLTRSCSYSGLQTVRWRTVSRVDPLPPELYSYFSLFLYQEMPLEESWTCSLCVCVGLLLIWFPSTVQKYAY